MSIQANATKGIKKRKKKLTFLTFVRPVSPTFSIYDVSHWGPIPKVASKWLKNGLKLKIQKCSNFLDSPLK